VRVQRERKGRRGKTVSVITGIAGSEAARLDVLKQLKMKLGTGGTLKEDAIEIQGDHRERIVELLNAMGYRAKQAGG
jgi:translation initiation factor 1